jgi:hypothetical protein
MIALNKQRQEHNNLVTNQRAKPNESMRAPRASNLLNPITQIRINRVVIEDYYHMTTIYENMRWMKLTHILSVFIKA